MLVGPVTGGVSAEAPFLCRLQGEMITFTIYLHMLTRTAPESPPE